MRLLVFVLAQVVELISLDHSIDALSLGGIQNNGDLEILEFGEALSNYEDGAREGSGETPEYTTPEFPTDGTTTAKEITGINYISL